MLTGKRTFITSLTLMFSLFLYVFLQLYIATPTRTKQSYFSQAAADNCATPSGNETYNGLANIGPNVAANISPDQYKQIRQLYNCQNGTTIAGKYIPTTVVYDLFFLKNDPSVIVQNLKDMKKYGLYPIIRVASYTSGRSWIKLFPPIDAQIMGEHLSQALGQVNGFPQNPIVFFGNEPNLNLEWGGNADASEFAKSFATFIDAMGKGNFDIYFPPLSYGATESIGILPTVFLNDFFNTAEFSKKKLAGAAFTIYGPSYDDIKSQLWNQKTAVKKYLDFFSDPMGILISEMGPTNNQGGITDCGPNSDWTKVAGPIISDYLKDPEAPFATMACFTTTQTYPVVINFQNNATQLISLAGQAGTTTTTAAGGGTATDGTTINGLSINFNPQNPTANTNFTITTASGTGFTWVYLKIFKQGDTNPFWVAANNLGDEPSVKNSPPYAWTYHINLGKPTALPDGDYKVTFYSDCDKGCSEKISRNLSIGAGKINPVQAAPQTNTQAGTNQQNIPAQQQQTGGNNAVSTPQAAKCKEYKINGRKQSKYNLVFLPAGYKDRQTFLNDVQISVDSLINKTNLDTNLASKINFYYYDDYNIDFQAVFCDFGICINQNTASQYKQICGGEGYALILNSDNSEKNKLGSSYEFCGNELAFSHSIADRGLAHELGHSLACLEDEYLYPDEALQGDRIPRRINCADQFSGNNNTACPGFESFSEAGCFVNCRYPDWYRSSLKSVMGGGAVENKIPLWDWKYNSTSLKGWSDRLQKYQ